MMQTTVTVVRSLGGPQRPETVATMAGSKRLVAQMPSYHVVVSVQMETKPSVKWMPMIQKA